MAETEVSKEVSKVVAIEEKCGLDMSSYQDLPKPESNGSNHHNQANDLDNSEYVFVTGADGLLDSPLDNKGVVSGVSRVPTQPEDSQNEIPGEVSEEAHHTDEGGNGKVEQINGNAYTVDYTCKNEGLHEDGNGVKVSVADSGEVNTCKTENLPEADQVSVADAQEIHTGKTGTGAEATVKQVEESNGKTERMPEAEVEKAVDQNGELEGMAEDEQKNLDGVTIAESPPCPVENQESQVGALDTVAEIGDNRELDNGFSNINGSSSFNNGENKSVNEAVERQKSQDVVVDEDQHELQNVCVEAGIEATPTIEVAEAAEHEVSTSTSLGLDSESLSVNGMDKTLEEEAKTDLSLDVDESKQGDSEADNTAQGMVGETDELKHVLSTTDSHMLPDLVVEENNGLSVSEVEDSVQYHEDSQEQPVVSSTDPQLVTISDVVLEDSSVSEVEHGVQYPEEIQEQAVVETTRDLVSEGKADDSSISEVENDAQYPEESQEQPDGHGASDDTISSESLIEVSVHTQSCPRPSVDAPRSVAEVSDAEEIGKVSSSFGPPQIETNEVEEIEEVSSPSVGPPQSETNEVEEIEEVSSPSVGPPQIETNEVEEIEEVSSPSVGPPQIETNEVEEIEEVSSPSVVRESQSVEQVVPGHDSAVRCTVDEAGSGSDSVPDKVVLEKEISSVGGETPLETEVLSGNSEVGDSSPETIHVKLESDGHVPDFSAMTSGEKTDDVAVTCRSEISDSCNANEEGLVNLELGVDAVEDVGDQLGSSAGYSKENLLVPEEEKTEDSQNEETSAPSAEEPITKAADEEDKSIKTKTRPFNFLIRTPRFDDENLREQIRLAKLQVDEKTKLRDAIQLQIQEKRASSQIHGIDYEYAKNESRSARKLVRSKRTEIDSLQIVINKAKNALSIEDIDNQIHNIEHMMQHETLPLKEEKQFIREIKQLKQLREQLSLNMGSQDEIKEALQQREGIEERLKILRKELDVLKSSVLKAEASAAEAGRRYEDENRKVKELQAQFRAANEVRQEAYVLWQNLRKELSKKSEYFFKYKDDAAVASNYAFSRDTEALYCLCLNQVGSFMELWNTNPEFRRDYIKFNERSNVRRFGTSDCRSLGPDEQPPALPSYAYDRGNRMASAPAKVDRAPQIPSAEKNQITPSENVPLDNKSAKKVTEPKNQKVSSVPAITAQVNGSDTHIETQLEVHEEPVISREEIESIRKAEEKRREEAEAKLKEQRRLEALAKANEARERKKRQAEKLQQRAELKTQKEAEQREKEREKRLRKKERKKAAGTDGNDSNNNCETAASSESAAENSKEADVKETTVSKKSQKPWLGAKQSKAKSIPPPLRNRNKKKLQQWMWVGVTSVVILVLFWMGNIGVFSNVALKRRAPVY